MGNPDRRVKASERARQALELRKAGLPYAEIASRLGWRTPSGAHAAVMRALDRAMREPAEELRKIELARLDSLHQAIWPTALRGDLGAIDRELRISERRAKLLGLDAPARQDVTSAGERVNVVLTFGEDSD